MKRRVGFMVAVVFLMSTFFITIDTKVKSAEIATDRIVRVATTTWSGNGTKQQNLDSIGTFIADAAKSKPDIVVLSEGVYSIDNSGPFFETIPGPFTEDMAAKAIQYNTYIVANMYEYDSSDNKRYNTSVLIDRQGTIIGKYRKMRLPPNETLAPYNMTEGTEAKVFDTEFGKLSMEICYDIDIRFPEVTKMHADLGAELILVSSWGDYTHAAAQFARQNNVFIVTSIRDHTWADAYPDSAIIANDGSVINGADNNSDMTCYADINLSNKTWSVPEPKWDIVTPPPIRASIPFTDITASDSLSGTNPQSLADGSIDNINAGPDKGHPYWSSNKKEPSLVFDMGSIKKVGSIGIVQYNAFEQEDYFKMYFSQDGINYVEYTKGLNYATRLLKDNVTGKPLYVKCYKASIFPGYKYIEVNPPFDIRYIKIVGYGNNTSSYKFTNLSEVTAFEPLDPQSTSAPFPTFTITNTPMQTATPTPTSMQTATATPTAIVTATLTPAATPSYEFNDVAETHWARDQIYSLVAKGAIDGYKNEDGSFSYKPEDNITRSEFIKILTCAFDVYDAGSTYDTFNDVNKGDWFYPYVASAVKEGLAIGISADDFGSNLQITREDLATFIARALVKYKGYTLPTDEQTDDSLSMFADKGEVQTYARPALALLVDNDVIKGYVEGSNTNFKPQNNATRAEVAAIVNRSVVLLDVNMPTATPIQ